MEEKGENPKRVLGLLLAVVVRSENSSLKTTSNEEAKAAPIYNAFSLDGEKTPTREIESKVEPR